MTSNPFITRSREVISHYEDSKILEEGSVTELLESAYWWEEAGGSVVEIAVVGLRFRDAAAASKAAKAMQPEMEENARVEPHTAPALFHRGSVVCLLQHTSAVDKDVWSGMVHLVENALAEMH